MQRSIAKCVFTSTRRAKLQRRNSTPPAGAVALARYRASICNLDHMHCLEYQHTNVYNSLLKQTSCTCSPTYIGISELAYFACVDMTSRVWCQLQNILCSAGEPYRPKHFQHLYGDSPSKKHFGDHNQIGPVLGQVSFL